MSDGHSLIPITDEQAKLGQEVIKAFRGLGAFLDKALGSTPEDLIGYFGGDRLRVRRAENMARMLADARIVWPTEGWNKPNLPPSRLRSRYFRQLLTKIATKLLIFGRCCSQTLWIRRFVM